MIAAVRSFLARRRLAKLQEAKDVAYLAYQGAYERGDTRRMHETWPALNRALTAQLRAELTSR